MKNKNTYQNRRMNKRFNAAVKAAHVGWALAHRDPDIHEIIDHVEFEHTIYEGIFPDVVRETYLRMDESEFRKYLMTAYMMGFEMGACPWKKYRIL